METIAQQHYSSFAAKMNEDFFVGCGAAGHEPCFEKEKDENGNVNMNMEGHKANLENISREAER